MDEDTWKDIKAESVREIKNEEMLKEKLKTFYELWQINENLQLKPHDDDEKICKNIEFVILQHWEENLR